MQVKSEKKHISVQKPLEVQQIKQQNVNVAGFDTEMKRDFGQLIKPVCVPRQRPRINRKLEDAGGFSKQAMLSVQIDSFF